MPNKKENLSKKQKVTQEETQLRPRKEPTAKENIIWMLLAIGAIFLMWAISARIYH